MSMSIVSVLIMVFVVNSLYFFWEVNALFICKPPEIQGFKGFRIIKKQVVFDTIKKAKEGFL